MHLLFIGLMVLAVLYFYGYLMWNRWVGVVILLLAFIWAVQSLHHS